LIHVNVPSDFADFQFLIFACFCPEEIMNPTLVTAFAAALTAVAATTACTTK
jgi:hypothetical protein